jgi:hypothetical protein
MQEQKLPLTPVDTELSEVLRLSEKLKTIDTKYKDDTKNITQDDRYNEGYRRDKVESLRVEGVAAVDTLVAEFQSTVAAKSEDLESKLKPVSAANLEPPSVLVIESDRALWIQQAEMKEQLSELVRLERLRMHQDDINGLQAVELVSEYQQAIEEADIAFCEAVERFGRRRLKKLSNGGDRSAAENVGRLGELMAQRADASLTPVQRKAKSDIEKLKDIGGKFFEMAHLTKQYTLRRSP